MVGGSGGGTSVQRTEPWSEAKPYYERMYQAAEQAYNKTSKTPYEGQRIAAPNPNTIEAQNKLLAFVPGGGTGYQAPGAVGPAPVVPQATLQPVARPQMAMSPTLMRFLQQFGGR